MKKILMLIILSFSALAYEVEYFKEINVYGVNCAKAQERADLRLQEYQESLEQARKIKRVELLECIDGEYPPSLGAHILMRVITTN